MSEGLNLFGDSEDFQIFMNTFEKTLTNKLVKEFLDRLKVLVKDWVAVDPNDVDDIIKIYEAKLTSDVVKG